MAGRLGALPDDERRLLGFGGENPPPLRRVPARIPHRDGPRGREPQGVPVQRAGRATVTSTASGWRWPMSRAGPHAGYLAMAASDRQFAFSAATANRRAMTAIRTSAAASVARSGARGVAGQPTTAWQRGSSPASSMRREAGAGRPADLQHRRRDPDAHQAAFAEFGFDSVLEDRGLANRVRTVRPGRPHGAHAFRHLTRSGDPPEVQRRGHRGQERRGPPGRGRRAARTRHADVRHHHRHGRLRRQRRDQPQLLCSRRRTNGSNSTPVGTSTPRSS